MLKCHIKLENENGVQSEWKLYSAVVRETVTSRVIEGAFHIVVTIDGFAETKRANWIPVTKADEKKTKANKRKVK